MDAIRLLLVEFLRGALSLVLFLLVGIETERIILSRIGFDLGPGDRVVELYYNPWLKTND